MKKDSTLFTVNYTTNKGLQSFTGKAYHQLLAPCHRFKINYDECCLTAAKLGKIIIEDFTLQEKIAHIDQQSALKDMVTKQAGITPASLFNFIFHT